MQFHSVTKITLLTTIYALTGALVVSLFMPSHPLFFSPTLRIILVIFTSVALTRYTAYLILGLWYSRKLHPVRTPTSNLKKMYHPLVSVIIPAWNEEVGLLPAVQSVLESSYRNIEIIVINDGSTDRSDTTMQAFLRNRSQKTNQVGDDIPITYRYQPNAGKANALNAGLSLAHGDIIVTIDADSHMDKHALAHFVTAFSDPRVMAAVGTVKIGNTGTIWGVIQRLEYITGFYFKRAESLLYSILVIGGAAGAFRRQVFEQLGPFRADHITEDIELTLRIQKAGMKIVYASRALVYTEGPSTLWGLMQQRLRWKRGRLSALREHRQLFFSVDPKHQLVLSWIILPLIVVGEISLLLEVPFVISLLIYGWASNDFTPFVTSIAIITCFTTIQIAVTENERDRLRLFMLTPISWWLLAAINYIELSALIRTLWLISRRRSVRWQRWHRVGALSHH